jgi:transcriptional regulator with XRE-family HTH domain
MRTRLQVAADRASAAQLRAIGEELRSLREDSGLSRAAVARVAGIHPSYVRLVESGQREASLAVLHRVAAALGADASLRLFPNSGPPIRDHIQVRMIEAFLSVLHPSWQRYPEVPVHRPVRGVIDLVIAHPPSGRVVSVEAHSDLRRLEQQLRWAAEKTDALPSAAVWPALTAGDRPATVSRILLLRSTRSTRSLARSFPETFAAAYPADPTSLLDGLLDPSTSWPGSGLLWVSLEGNSVAIIRGVPRGARGPAPD